MHITKTIIQQAILSYERQVLSVKSPIIELKNIELKLYGLYLQLQEIEEKMEGGGEKYIASKKLTTNKLLVTFYYFLGIHCGIDKKRKKPEEAFILCKHFAAQSEDDILLIKVLKNIAVYHFNKGDLRQSIQHSIESLQIAQKIGELIFVAEVSLNLGIVYSKLNDYEKGMDYLVNAIKIFEDQNKSFELSSCYNAMGNLFTSMGNYSKSIEVHKKALQLREKLKLKIECAKSKNNIGSAHKNMKEWKAAEDYFQKALTLAGEDKYVLAAIWGNLGEVYQATQRYEQAKNYHLKCLEARKESEDRIGLASTLYSLGQLYTQLKQYPLAQKYIAESLEIAQTNDKKDLLLENYLLLKDIHTDLADYQTALKYANEIYQIRETMHNEHIHQTVFEKQIKYETEKKEREIEFLNKENELRTTLLRELHHRVKNNLLVLSTLLGSQFAQLQDGAAKEAIKESESRVKAMYLIHSKLYREEHNQLINMREYVEKLTKQLMRSYGFNRRTLSLKIEIEDIAMDVDKAIPLCLIINELVCNSFKYAFVNVSKPKLNLKLKQFSLQKLTLTLKDNGSAKKSDFESSNSFGMSLIEKLTLQLEAEKELKLEKGTLWKFVIPYK